LTLNLLAFLAHTFLEVVDTQYRTIRQVLSARKTFFHDFTTLTKYLFFDSWSHLILKSSIFSTMICKLMILG
jgi:hypothetical protein